MIVFIDSSVLGILANPNRIGEASDCREWLYKLLSRSAYVCSGRRGQGAGGRGQGKKGFLYTICFYSAYLLT
ncbi:MAG: hypothetical protein ACRAVC_12885 [Trichormus sp.]